MIQWRRIQNSTSIVWRGLGVVSLALLVLNSLGCSSVDFGKSTEALALEPVGSRIVESHNSRKFTTQKPIDARNDIWLNETPNDFELTTVKNPSIWRAQSEDAVIDQDDSQLGMYFQMENDAPSTMTDTPGLVQRLWLDQRNFYSPESLANLGGGLAIGGLIANSQYDESLHRHFQSGIRNANSDEWFESLHASKELGDGRYTLPIFATAWIAGELMPDSLVASTAGTWGERTIRGFLVGAPPMLALQRVVGGSRPGESDHAGDWTPFHDNNGISGHSFMGSMPFITAAKMTDSRALKVVFYAASFAAPLSRVNDDAHYPSQVALGWWIAYLSASAVQVTDNPQAQWRIYPVVSGDTSGFMFERKF